MHCTNSHKWGHDVFVDSAYSKQTDKDRDRVPPAPNGNVWRNEIARGKTNYYNRITSLARIFNLYLSKLYCCTLFVYTDGSIAHTHELSELAQIPPKNMLSTRSSTITQHHKLSFYFVRLWFALHRNHCSCLVFVNVLFHRDSDI